MSGRGDTPRGHTARGETAAAALRAGGRVLVTRLQYLGDVILTLPVVDAIRERFPDAEVDYLCRPPASELLLGDGRFARVFPLERKPGIGASLSLVRRLRARRYDVVIDLYSNPRSAWLSWLTGARVRVGADRRGRRHLYTHAVSVPAEIRLATEFHMKYLEPIGVSVGASTPSVVLAPDDRRRARSMLESLGVKRSGENEKKDKPLVGIHPGGKWAVKRWPSASFAELIKKMTTSSQARVVVLTGPEEAEHTERLMALVGEDVVCLPPLPVRSVAALIAEFDAMVANDGGIMHLAAAVGTATVGIFGSSEPDIWFPYGPSGRYQPAYIDLDCRPCHRHECPLGHTNCLNALTPETVLGSVESVLRANEERRRGRRVYD